MERIRLSVSYYHQTIIPLKEKLSSLNFENVSSIANVGYRIDTGDEKILVVDPGDGEAVNWDAVKQYIKQNNITGVVLSHTVKSIGNRAFNGIAPVFNRL